MPSNPTPHHGYLTEPRWFTARAVGRELTCLDTWAQVFAIGAFLFMLVMMIIAG